MRWFKHMSTSFYDEKLSQLVDQAGLEGYGFWWAVLEIIAQKVDSKNNASCTFSERRWVGVLQTNHKKFRKLLNISEGLGLFQIEIDGEQIRIECRNLLKFKDEYSKKSGHCQESVRTNSGAKKQIQKQSIETETEKNNILRRADENVASTPPIFMLPVTGGKTFPVTSERITEWSALYPAVSIDTEIRKMIGWFQGNPTKLKTARGIARFIHSWLSRQQDSGGARAAPSPPVASVRHVSTEQTREQFLASMPPAMRERTLQREAQRAAAEEAGKCVM